MTGHSQLTLSAPPDVFQQRRARLAGRLRRPIVVFAGQAPPRNYATNPYPFRAGSSYLYLGGPPLENAALLIDPESDGGQSWLLRVPAGPDDALWTGTVADDATLAHAAGIPAGTVADLDRLGGLLKNRPAAFVPTSFPGSAGLAARLGLSAADREELLAIIDMRVCKDDYELAAMRQAAVVNMRAHRAALSAARVGRREADVAAAFHAVLVGHDCVPSFTPIITIRGEVLHGHGHANVLVAGSLLLIDGGAEEPGGYACDITRTAPVGGKWDPTQRQLYDTVLRTVNEATRACVPGARFRDVHDLAARVICEGLLAAGLLRGDLNTLVERRAHTLFFPHGLGHLIGLDVHDMEDFGDLAGYAAGRTRRTAFGDMYLRLDRDLSPGMTLTIEPGIYLVPAIWEDGGPADGLRDLVDGQTVQALLKDGFGGIRVEHTICVREQGEPEVLTENLPTDADEVAACIGA